MHEMSITQSVVELCEEHAQGRKVLSVTLQIGAVSGVIPDSIQFCFEACTQGTLLDGARLDIELIPAQGLCPICGASSRVDNIFDPCPSCGAFGLELTAGKEMRVKELEVE